MTEYSEFFDCLSCGVCCATRFSEKKTYVKIDQTDYLNIPSDLRDGLVTSTKDGNFLSTKQNKDGVTVCAALEGIVGKSVECGIYAKRPLICRIFEPGSPECLIARDAFGLELPNRLV